MDLLYFVKYIHIYLELVLVRVDTDVLRPSDLQFEIIIFMLHGILIFYNLYLKLWSPFCPNQLTPLFLPDTNHQHFHGLFRWSSFSQMKLSTKLLL